MACPACSEPVPDGARFCPSCGTAQTSGAARAVGDERRVVTVVFADLVGFTGLAEHRDPEQVKRLVDAVFERLVAVVSDHGGVVDKVLGDAIIALFGAPVAHEDDPERAVRAGLAMLDVLAAVRSEHPDDDIRMRIGVNTGEVLVGTVAGTDYTAMGDVVNTASRLQELAPVGAVLVGDETKQQCSAAIDFEMFETVRLRGRGELSRVWRASGVGQAVVGSRPMSDVAFVGRTAEMAMVNAVTSSVAAGRAAVVTVSGEAGIGKSRLISEALRSLLVRRPDTIVLGGRCAPYGEPNVWWPLVGGLLHDLGLDRSGGPAAIRRRIVRRLPDLDLLDRPQGATVSESTVSESDERVELVMHLLGQASSFDELGPAAVREAVAGKIVDALRARASRTPVVIRIDDLHWAAPVLLGLLETLIRQLADMPVLTVVSHRPFDDGDPDWPPSVDPVTTVRLRLDPLGDPEAERLVREVCAADPSAPEPSGDHVARIIGRSGGNPLFLTELARLPRPDGMPDSVEAHLPASVRSLIAARLDGLGAAERAVVDNAAIIGHQGRISSLRRFAVELGQRFDPAAVDALVAEGFLVRERASWWFRSDVVREVAYTTLTKHDRAVRHAGVARYLAEFDPDAVDRRAHHLASAAELSAELGEVPGVDADVADTAVALLAEAARRWNRQGAHRRALGAVERALALHAEGDPVDRELRLLQVSTLTDLRLGRRARMLADDLVRDSVEADDRVVLGEAMRVLGSIQQADGDLVGARTSLGSAVAIFREMDDVDHLAEALRARGFAEVFGGSLADAGWFLGEAAALFEASGRRRGLAWVLQNQAWVSFMSGDHRLAESRLRTAEALFDELGDRSGRSWSRGLLAHVHHFLRRNDLALLGADEVLADARRWGDEWGASMILNLQGSIWLWRDDPDRARELARRALAGFRRLDDRFGTIQALTTLSRASAATGRWSDVDRAVEEVLALSDSFGAMAFPSLAAAGAAVHVGNGPRAVEQAVVAIDRLDVTGAHVDEATVLSAFGHLLCDDADRALAVLVDLDVAGSPFALAARATARAAVGDVDGTVGDVDALRSAGSPPFEVSYWDRAVAEVAALAVAAPHEAGRRAAEVGDLAERTGDVVIAAYADAVLVGLGHRSRRSTSPVPIGGWATLAGRLAGVRRAGV